MSDRLPPRPAPASAASLRRAGRERGRAVVALARERLRRASGGRVAGVLGLLAASGVAGLLLFTRVSAPEAPLPLLAAAAGTLAWIAGGPIALAAANDRRAADARDGLEALAASRGIPGQALEAARVVAAVVEVTRAIGLPLLVVGVAGIAFAPTLATAVESASALVGLALFAIGAGVTLGGLGALCGRAGGRRGRWLLAALVLGPWLVGDLVGHAAWSIPGALEALLTFALQLATGAGAHP